MTEERDEMRRDTIVGPSDKSSSVKRQSSDTLRKLFTKQRTTNKIHVSERESTHDWDVTIVTYVSCRSPMNLISSITRRRGKIFLTVSIRLCSWRAAPRDFSAVFLSEWLLWFPDPQINTWRKSSEIRLSSRGSPASTSLRCCPYPELKREEYEWHLSYLSKDRPDIPNYYWDSSQSSNDLLIITWRFVVNAPFGIWSYRRRRPSLASV